MAKNPKIRWLKQPEEQDYPSAKSYLSLIYTEPAAAAYAKKLQGLPVRQFKAKDIFRAARLPLLKPANSHVKKDRQKIKAGQAISPLLLVRDSTLGRVIIADGYHRLCATYSFDEDAVIPCKIL